MSMKGLCKAIGYIDLIGGVFIAFLLAKAYGNPLAAIGGERSWPATIGIFVGVFGSALVSAIIMFAIDEILSDHSDLWKKLIEIENKLK